MVCSLRRHLPAKQGRSHATNGQRQPPVGPTVTALLRAGERRLVSGCGIVGLEIEQATLSLRLPSGVDRLRVGRRLAGASAQVQTQPPPRLRVPPEAAERPPGGGAGTGQPLT